MWDLFGCSARWLSVGGGLKEIPSWVCLCEPDSVAVDAPDDAWASLPFKRRGPMLAADSCPGRVCPYRDTKPPKTTKRP
jgi:hypothetical protein